MRKFWFILPLVAVMMAFFACTERNTPTDTTTTDVEGDTGIEDDKVDEQNWSDTIQIVWNGTSATITGAHDSIQITNSNGYVTVNSSVTETRIVYLLSGNGTGQLSIYGVYRHNITLDGLTLTCSNGPAINNQCHKKCFLVINGTNTLTDGSPYASSTDADRKAAFFSEGQIVLSGAGSLTVKGNYKHAMASDDYIHLTEELTGILHLTASTDGLHANDGIYIYGGTATINAGNDGLQSDSIISITGGTLNITATDKGIVDSTGGIFISGGTINISSEYKCIKSKANLRITGGEIKAICTGAASSGGGPGGGGPGGNNWWGGGSSSSSSPEAIEAKGTITITGGTLYAQSADDAINAGGDLTISGGYVCAYSTSNDGIDANGNCYIKGGLIYAIGSRSPEVAIDANTEEGKKLYVTGGTIVAVGSLEGGASLSQTCYQASGSSNTWFAMKVGDNTFAFKTPSSNASTLVVSGASQPKLYKSVSPSGTAIFNGMAYYPASYSGGSEVTLSSYSGGGRPGGH